MYHLDPNINTAMARQADRMHAVRALRSSSNPSSHPVTPAWTNSQPSRITTKVTLALAAVVPIVLVWAHVGVAGQIRSGQAHSLALTRCLHASLHDFRWFTQALIGQLLIRNARNIHTRSVSIRSSNGPLMRF